MLGRDLSSITHPESGFTGGWHGTSHHGDTPANIANYAKVNRYHVANLAYFMDKLSKIDDVEGTALDNVLIYKGSNMGNSHRHAHEKVPVIRPWHDGTFLARHISYTDNVEAPNMLLSLLLCMPSKRTVQQRHQTAGECMGCYATVVQKKSVMRNKGDTKKRRRAPH